MQYCGKTRELPYAQLYISKSPRFSMSTELTSSGLCGIRNTCTLI